jgi:hypothetical protein
MPDLVWVGEHPTAAMRRRVLRGTEIRVTTAGRLTDKAPRRSPRYRSAARL